MPAMPPMAPMPPVTPRLRSLRPLRRVFGAGLGLALGACDPGARSTGALEDPSSAVHADAETADMEPADAVMDTLRAPDLTLGALDLGPGGDGAPVDAAPPPPRDGHPRFRFGIADADRRKMMPSPVFHVDQDPVDHPEARATCTNFEGQHFPFCYDGHRGSDFMLGGGFSTMDNGSAEVVAAAGGLVEAAEDGHYDRCHGSAVTLDVTCDGHEMQANFVRLRHANGWVSLYYHLKSGSVAVRVGDAVSCGDRLGLVGSSGVSTLPHLHFQVEDPDGAVVDPFAGPASQPESLFTEQAADDGLPGADCDPLWTRAPDAGP